MDWHAWLSPARLEPALVHEYALVFARNELDADDVAYLDHEFLRSMGISVAKHRLEILKLERRRRRRHRRRLLAVPPRLVLAAVGRAARFVLSLVHREESSALVLVPTQPQPDAVSCSRRRGGGGKEPKRARSKPKGAPAVLAIAGRGAATVHAIKGGAGDGEEAAVRWDRLFHDLKPN